jgi:hypothetical protein
MRGNGGVWWSVHLAAVWSQAVGFVLMRLSGISHRENVFTFNLLYKYYESSYFPP